MRSGRALPVLLLMVLISIVGFGVVIPLLPFYGKMFGAPAWQITLLFSMFSLGQFVGELTWGRISDRVGRKPVLLGTNLASAVSYLAFAFAPDIWTAIAIRTASGFFSGNVSTIQSYMADVSSRERLVGRMGLVGAALGSGFVLGPALGGLLAHPELGAAGFRLPMLAAAALFVVSALGVFLFVRESRREHAAHSGGLPTALRLAFADPTLRRVIAITFVAMSAFSAMWSTLGFWGEERFGWGPMELGIVMALVGAGAAVGQGVVAAPVNRMLGEVRTIATGILVCAFFLLVQAASPWSMLAGLALFLAVTGHTLSQPAAASLISRTARPEEQGSTLGANAAAAALARVGGPVLGGFLYSALGPQAPLIAAAAGMLPAAWLAFDIGRRMREEA